MPEGPGPTAADGVLGEGQPAPYTHQLEGLGQGRRHNFKSGGYKYHCERSESEQKFFWHCTPRIPFWGVQQLQREAYGEAIGQRCYNRHILYWSCACSGL